MPKAEEKQPHVFMVIMKQFKQTRIMLYKVVNARFMKSEGDLSEKLLPRFILDLWIMKSFIQLIYELWNLLFIWFYLVTLVTIFKPVCLSITPCRILKKLLHSKIKWGNEKWKNRKNATGRLRRNLKECKRILDLFVKDFRWEKIVLNSGSSAEYVKTL